MKNNNLITTNNVTTEPSKIATTVANVKAKLISFFEDHFVAMIFLGILALNIIGFALCAIPGCPQAIEMILGIVIGLIDLVAMFVGVMLLASDSF